MSYQTDTAFDTTQSESLSPNVLIDSSAANLKSNNITRTDTRNIAFVDAGLSDIDTLIKGLENTQIVLLDSQQNGIDQITSVLAEYNELGSVHIFSHGTQGSLQLGNTDLNNSTIEGYSNRLSQWQSALSSEADILFYGCDLAAGDEGMALTHRISQLTGADVAASNDLTGIGGDWQLEVTVGEVESAIALSVQAQAAYNGTLALLSNGDFESDLSAWGSFTGTETISTTESFSGGKSLQLSAAGSGASQTLDVIAGETYTFTGNAKTSSSGYNAVGINFFDEDFNFLDGAAEQITSTDWSSYQLESVAVAGSRYVQIWAYKDEIGGDFFVDNLTLDTDAVAPPPPPTGSELLSNPGFESGGLDSWFGFTGSETVSDTESFAGGNALQLSGADSGTAQFLDATAGTEYSFSGYAKTSSSGYVGVGLNFFDANYNALGGSINKTVTTADWQQFQETSTAPAGTQFVQIWTYKSDASGDAFFDEFSLTVNDGTPPPTDTTAPTAALSATPLTTEGTTQFDFTLTYSDDTAVDVTSLDSSDIRVTGPNGYNQIATLVSVNDTTNGTPRPAVYRITAPNSTWQDTDNGTYTVALRSNQVQDTSGNAATAANIGTFAVNIDSTPVEAGFIALQSSTISVDEDGGNATLTVQRTGGSDGTITVDYSTVEVTGRPATANVDYSTRSGTLTFADGETEKSVLVPILNDTLAEGTETFGFAIDNVQGGATLLAPRTAQITIADDDTLTYNGNQYVLTNGAKTWEQAQAEAESLGGNLVTINAAAEETWLKQNFGDTEGFWIGINDIATEGQFVWASGEAVTYTNWAPGEPNNGGGNQDFGWMNFSTTRQWDDNSPGVQLRGIIEIGDNNGPVTPPTSQGNGLKAEYYNNSNFTNLALTRTDATVAFNWGSGSPDPAIGADTFSVRWTGQIEPLYSETYTFQTNTDDGVRLWVNNQLIIDKFIDQAPTAHAGSITLNAGQRYDIRMEYYENGGGAQAQLAWSSASQDFEVVSRSQLYSEPTNNATVSAETVVSALNSPTAIDWRPNSDQMFIAEKGGKVEIFENGTLLATPFIDISDQVNGTRDRGLLDIAMHPDFVNNPYVYLLFTYDPPEVFNFTGDSGPDGKNNRAARLIRVTADASNGYRTAVAGSEVVLLGKNSTWNNFNGLTNSTVNFNEPEAGVLPDGTYLQDFLNADSESHTIGAVEFGPDGALYVTNGDGASYNRVDPRAARVQDVDSLSGKVLRIDPITGKGLSDNPFYNGNADANRSKVYQLGLRNPFRMTIDPDDGQIYVGDVGWTQWEEINAAGAGANFGWPYYEGGNGVSSQTGGYNTLPEAQAFYNSTTVTPSLLGLNHTTDGINAIVLGDLYKGNVYDNKYQGDLFFNDLGQGIVRNVSFDSAGNISGVETFATGASFVVQMVEGPDELMYYVNLVNGTVGRWVFT